MFKKNIQNKIEKIFQNKKYDNIYLRYNLKKIEVELDFIDSKFCYFVPLLGSSGLVEKINKNTKAELLIYTENGIFISNVIIQETNLSIGKGYKFVIKTPKSLNHVQLRLNNREDVIVPLTIELDPENIIQAESFNLSKSGIAILLNTELKEMYKKLPLNISINLLDEVINLTAKYSRETKKYIEYKTDILYGFKFINLTEENKEMLDTFFTNLNNIKKEL